MWMCERQYERTKKFMQEKFEKREVPEEYKDLVCGYLTSASYDFTKSINMQNIVWIVKNENVKRDKSKTFYWIYNKLLKTKNARHFMINTMLQSEENKIDVELTCWDNAVLFKDEDVDLLIRKKVLEQYKKLC